MKHAAASRGFSTDHAESSGNSNTSSSSSNANEGWYDLLQIPRDASAETVKRAYRQLALLWHPDKGGSVTRFQSLTAAWEVLGNAERRRLYDRQLLRSGSSDGINFKRRSSWAGTAGTATTGGITAASRAASQGGAATAAETPGWANGKPSAESLFLRKRRHHPTRVDAAPMDMQQHKQQQPQQQQQQRAAFRTWTTRQNFPAAETAASSTGEASEGASAKRWSCQGGDFPGFAGTTGTATTQPSSEASERLGKARAAVGSGHLPSAGQQYSQQPQQHVQPQDASATAHRSSFEWNGPRVLGKEAGETTGCSEDFFHSSQHSNSKTRMPSLYTGGITARVEVASTDAAAAIPSSNSQAPWQSFPSSSSSSVQTAAPGSTWIAGATAAAVSTHRAAAAAAAVDSETTSEPPQWTNGRGSSDSLAKLETGLNHVLGEEGVHRMQSGTVTPLHERVQQLGVKQLKQLLSFLSIPHTTCIEKHDLLDALAQAFPDVTASKDEESASSSNSASHTDGSDKYLSRIGSHSSTSSSNTAVEQGSYMGEISAQDSRDSRLYIDSRSDSKSSLSSSDSGVFHKFHSPAAGARGAFAYVKRDVHAVVAAVRQRCLKRRQQCGLNIPSSAAASAVVGSQSAATGAPSCADSEHLTPEDRKSSRETFPGASGQNMPVGAGLLHSNLRIKLITLGGEKTGKSCIIKRYCEGRFVARNAATIALDYGVKVVKVKQQQNKGKEQQPKNQGKQYDSGNQQTTGDEQQRDGPPQQQQQDATISVGVNFFDFSGKREFKEARREFYPHTDGVMLVYDVSRRESFLQLKEWLEEAPNLLLQHHNTHQLHTLKQKEWFPHSKNGFLGGVQSRPPIVMLLGNKVDLEREVQAAEGEAFAQEHGMLFFETSASSGHNIVNALETLFEATAARVTAFRNTLFARLFDCGEPTASVKTCAAAAAANGESHASARQVSSL